MRLQPSAVRRLTDTHRIVHIRLCLPACSPAKAKMKLLLSAAVICGVVMWTAADPLAFIHLPARLHCPLPNSVGYKCEELCDVDEDCEVDQYCCLTSCGKTCMQRYQATQSLNCPAPNPLIRCLNFSHECNNDQECSKEGRRGYCCLESACSRRCKEGKPPTQSAECPAPYSFGINCFVFRHLCITDQECRRTGRGAHCCLVAGCGNTCV